MLKVVTPVAVLPMAEDGVKATCFVGRTQTVSVCVISTTKVVVVVIGSRRSCRSAGGGRLKLIASDGRVFERARRMRGNMTYDEAA